MTGSIDSTITRVRQHGATLQRGRPLPSTTKWNSRAAEHVEVRFWTSAILVDWAPISRHGLTYSGHATACAVAHANIDILEREDLVTRSRELEGVLHRALAPLTAHPLVDEIRSGVGFMAGVQLAAAVNAESVANNCIDEGQVIMRALRGNTLQICPPVVVTEDDVHLLVRTLENTLNSLT